jgi:hypothetical protein
MAEYPETVDFLVTVMNLGSDQIAADELETARASLRTLTGQDFALDGPRWTAWLAQNGGASGSPGIGEGLPPPPGSLPAAPRNDVISALPDAPASQRKEVDVAQWGIVVDSADIPMVPEVEGAGGGGPAGLSGLAGLLNRPGSGAAEPGGPAALSASDFGEDGAGGGRTSSMFPTASSGRSMFRNWEADPRDAAPAPALPPPPTTSSTWDRASAPAASAAPEAPAASAARTQSSGDAPAGIRLPLPPMAGGADEGMTSDLPSFSPLPGEGFSGIYQPEPEPEPVPAYDSYGEPDYGMTAGTPQVDVSGYGGSSAFTDELHSETPQGTGNLIADTPSYAGPTMMTDPNFIPSGDMPMEAYDEAGSAVMPPPPGGILSGEDDSFGMTEEGGYEDGSAMTLPPFGGGDSASATPFPEDEGFDFDETDSTESAMADEPEIPSGDMENREKESVIVSGRVPSSSGGSGARSSAREAAPAQAVKEAQAEIPAPAAAAPAPAPRARAASSASSPVRPPKGESVWVPGDDPGDSQSGGAATPGTAEALDDDTAFQILPAPSEDAAEYITADELMDMETYAESVETAEPAGTAETGGGLVAPGTGGVSLPVPGAASGSDAGDYLRNDPYGDFAPAAPVDSAVDSAPASSGDGAAAEETDSGAYETYETYTAKQEGGLTGPSSSSTVPAAVPAGAPDASAPGLSLPLPGGGDAAGETVDAMQETATSGDSAAPTWEDATETSLPPFGSENAGETMLFDASAADAALQEDSAAAMTETETASPVADSAALPQSATPPAPKTAETAPSMLLTLPGGFAAPQDLSGQDMPSLPPFETGLPQAATEQGQSGGGLSIPPLGAPQIQLPDPVSGDGDGFPAMNILPVPPSSGGR